MKFVALGDVAEFIMGQAPPSSETNRQGVGVPFVQVRNFGPVEPRIEEWTTKPLRFAESGDVLVCVVGATAGKVNLAINAAITRSIAAVRPTSELDQKYLYHYLVLNTLKLRSQSAGSAQGVLSKQHLEQIQLPLPPIEEQHKIVKRVESALAKINESRKQIEVADLQAKQFGRALYLEIGSSWVNATSLPILEVCNAYQPKTISTKQLVPSGKFPVYGANGQIGFFNEFNHDESQVTVTCRGATCGTVNRTPANCWITGNAMVVAPKDDRLSSEFLELCLRNSDFSEVITGTAQPQITRQSLAALLIKVPSRLDQDRAVSAMAAADQLMKRYEVEIAFANAKLDSLERAILWNAFSVPEREGKGS